MKLATPLLSIILLFLAQAHSATLQVPGGYTTIQQAIDAASPGDVVLVAPGVYVENIDFSGKAITVMGSGGASVTTLDGGAPADPEHGSTVYFTHGEGSDSLLQGFTITNGKGTLEDSVADATDYYGGGIFCVASSPTLLDCVITGNSSEFGDGAGIYAEGSTSLISGCVISDNFAGSSSGVESSLGGGLACLDSSLTIRDCTVSGNKADRGGGGIEADQSTLVLEDCVFSRNQTLGHTGGGFLECNFCTVSIEGCQVEGNESFWVGGIYAYKSALTIRNSRFEENQGYSFSGALSPVECLSVEVMNTVFVRNRAASGGAVSLYSQPNDFRHCIFLENEAQYARGGAVQIFGADTIFRHCTFMGNSAAEMGGGVYSGNYAVFTLANCFLFGNQSNGEGGGLYLDGTDSATLLHCTFCENEADYDGGAFYGDDCLVEAHNSIFWNDYAYFSKEAYLGGSTKMVVSHSDLEGGQASIHADPTVTVTWGDGMIDGDPLFVDGAGADMHLTYLSPCRNAGDNAFALEPYDFEADPRIVQGVADMGADEFHYHLYVTGNNSPGGEIKGKLIGIPGSLPVDLFFSDSLAPVPLHVAWGNFYLAAPWLMISLIIPIPANGALILPATLPETPAGPYDLYMQALIGTESDSLTNVYKLHVE